MRVLVAHNSYKIRGGEDAVVESEVALLRQHGHEVSVFLKSNDDISGGRISLAATAIWSRDTVSELERLSLEFKPDVVHVHNTLPLISPAVYWPAARAKVPVVQTLHNFRMICPQAMLLRDGKVCEQCVGKSPLPAVRYGCYRDSRAQSAVVAGTLMTHRLLGTYKQKVAKYIALNEFCKEKFIQGGLPEDRIVVKPNFVDAPVVPEQERSGLLFVGRLSREKGVATLASALAGSPELPVSVAGEGPEESGLRAVASVDLLGRKTLPEIYGLMGRAQALVLPSVWYENFPRTLVEAFACSLPVIASRIGSLAELIEDGKTGILVPPGDPGALRIAMEWALGHPERMREMGRAARAVYEQRYTAQQNYSQLRQIYEEVCFAPAPLIQRAA